MALNQRGSRPRDTQRAKLYRAENQAFTGVSRELTSVGDCQDYVDAVLRSRFVQARWGQRRIVVHDGRGQRSASATLDGKRINLPGWARKRWVILHEIAHCLTTREDAWHGPEFAGIYLTLVGQQLGDLARAGLLAAFRTQRVRVSRSSVPAATRTVYTAQDRHRQARDAAARDRAALLTPPMLTRTASVLRAGVKDGLFGPSGSSARRHALTLARRIDALTSEQAAAGGAP